jgi:hypothetical protein
MQGQVRRGQQAQLIHPVLTRPRIGRLNSVEISSELGAFALKASEARPGRTPVEPGLLPLLSTDKRLGESNVKSRDEQLTWAKQRALICVGVGRFADAVAGLRADLDKGVMSSEHAMRGYKAARRSAGVRKR